MKCVPGELSQTYENVEAPQFLDVSNGKVSLPDSWDDFLTLSHSLIVHLSSYVLEDKAYVLTVNGPCWVRDVEVMYCQCKHIPKSRRI